MTAINFQEAFNEAEANSDFDRLLVVLHLTSKAVKAERDRLDKDGASATKFAAAITKVTKLSKQLADDPSLIDDYLLATTEMKRANTTRVARDEKSESQWPAINVCFDEATYMLESMTAAEKAALAEAA